MEENDEDRTIKKLQDIRALLLIILWQSIPNSISAKPLPYWKHKNSAQMLLLGNGTLICHYSLVKRSFFRKMLAYSHRDVTMVQPVVLYDLEEILFMNYQTITELM